MAYTMMISEFVEGCLLKYLCKTGRASGVPKINSKVKGTALTKVAGLFKFLTVAALAA